jgi:hypothetical protein
MRCGHYVRQPGDLETLLSVCCRAGEAENRYRLHYWEEDDEATEH